MLSRTLYIRNSLKKVIDQERSMFYQGDDVEPIPHVRDEIIDEIVKAGKTDKADVVFTELGGTVGEPTNSIILSTTKRFAR
jgi:CTP synthase